MKRFGKRLSKKLLKTVTFGNGKEFSKHREIELDNMLEVLLELNKRERKCLNYNTPLEVL